MPQAYYMLCRKFPASYNKETARHCIGSSEQIAIAVTCRVMELNVRTRLFEHHLYAPLSGGLVSKMNSVPTACL